MFILKQVISGRTNQPELLYMPATPGETYSVGEALVYNTDGQVSKAIGSVTASYISQEACEVPAKSEKMLAVTRITGDQLYETTVADRSSSYWLGRHYSFGGGGLYITNSFANDAFGAELVSYDKAKGKALVFLK